jgi:hypothetical protein
MSTHARLKRRSRVRGGNVLIDSILGLILLSMGAASFYSLFPVIAKAQAMGDEEQKATQICTKMLEHIQLLSPGKLTATNLSGMLLIDTGQAASPYTFNHCPLDDATDFAPADCLKNGTGTLTITSINYGSSRVIATVTWKTPTGKTETVTMGTILGAHRS